MNSSLSATPIVPVAAGSLIAPIFNFAGARWWVFADAGPGRRL